MSYTSYTHTDLEWSRFPHLFLWWIQDVERWPDARTSPGILLFEFRGPLVFASAEWFEEEVERKRLQAKSCLKIWKCVYFSIENQELLKSFFECAFWYSILVYLVFLLDIDEVHVHSYMQDRT